MVLEPSRLGGRLRASVPESRRELCREVAVSLRATAPGPRTGVTFNQRREIRSSNASLSSSSPRSPRPPASPKRRPLPWKVKRSRSRARSPSSTVPAATGPSAMSVARGSAPTSSSSRIQPTASSSRVGSRPAPRRATVAIEGQSFSLAGSTTVQYGANGNWISKTLSAGQCTNEFFGSDPAVGIVKSCVVEASAQPTAAALSTTAAPAPAPVWTPAPPSAPAPTYGGIFVNTTNLPVPQPGIGYPYLTNTGEIPPLSGVERLGA